MLNDQSITSSHNEPQRSPGFVLFVSPQNTITNSSDEFGLEEISTECKVNIFLSLIILFNQMQPYYFLNISVKILIKFFTFSRFLNSILHLAARTLRYCLEIV